MNKSLLSYLIVLMSFSSCFSFEDKGPLKFSAPVSEETAPISHAPPTNSNPRESTGNPNQEVISGLLEQIRLLQEKQKAWNEIITSAQESFDYIRPIVRSKCFACHNSNTPISIFGRPFPERNPIRTNRDKAIKSLDFSTVFPLRAHGNPKQLAILQSLKSSVLDKTMPPEVYSRLNPWKKLKLEEQNKLLSWLNPLIQKIEEFEQLYEIPFQENTLETKIKKVFELKCIRCHGNENSRGDFTGMEDLESLIQSKYINLENPQESIIYQLAARYEMPPSIRESLTPEELELLLRWIEQESISKN